MEFIVFKDGKKSLNLRINDECDSEKVINSVKYCMGYLELSNECITLRKLKRFLKYVTTVTTEISVEKSIVIDLDNIDACVESNNLDEELVERFNEIISGKYYKEYLEFSVMILTWIILYASSYIPSKEMQMAILVVMILLDLIIIIRMKDIVIRVVDVIKVKFA